VIDFFFPAKCGGCGEPGADLCAGCEAVLATRPAILLGARDGLPPLTALGAYEGRLRNVVLALKFRGARAVGVRLGRWLGAKTLLPYDAIVPVPLHADRLRERGYNQAAAIACGIAAAARGRVVDGALRRIRATKVQSALDRAERYTNVERAFAPGDRAATITGRCILLVDDVVTTGATIRACAHALRDAGVASISVTCAAVRL
jgi:ComF family protein